MRRKKWLFSLTVIMVNTVLLLVLLEGATRVLWHHDLEEQHIGIVLKGADREVVHEGVTYKTNSHGLRNREVEVQKAAATKRILALGDSFTWGDGLPADELITVKIEAFLKPDFQGIEVINGALSDSNTADEFQQLVRLAPIYNPDVVILFFFTNDVVAGSESMVSWRMKLKEFLRHHSKFVAFVYYQVKTKYAVGVPKSLLPAEYFNLDDSKPGWVSFKKNLLQIRDYCQNQNVTFQFVVIPTLTILNQNYPYQELRQKVISFARSSGIHTLDLFDSFSPFHPSDLWVSLENTHWNSKATSIAAGKVVADLHVLLESLHSVMLAPALRSVH